MKIKAGVPALSDLGIWNLQDEKGSSAKTLTEIASVVTIRFDQIEACSKTVIILDHAVIGSVPSTDMTL